MEAPILDSVSLGFFVFLSPEFVHPIGYILCLLHTWPLKTLDTLYCTNCWSQISKNVLHCKNSWKTRVHGGQWKFSVFYSGSFLTGCRVGSLLIWFLARVHVKERLEEKQHTSNAQAKKHLLNTPLCPCDGAESSFFIFLTHDYLKTCLTMSINQYVLTQPPNPHRLLDLRILL